MQTINRLEMLRSSLDALRRNGGTLALVPTMGALHEGHLTLVREARRHADHVVVSIFVNPRQFGPGEDLDAYPRQLARDARLLEGEGTAVLWVPEVTEMYPAGFATEISVAGVSEGLCGDSRAGHFNGVATVVLKLFNQVQPDFALFGEKDWQQLAVIRRLAHDLDLTCPRADAIIAVPTVREADSLALSSRNAYLSADQRRAAAALPDAMRMMSTALREGREWPSVQAEAVHQLLRAGFDQVEYLELRDGESLALLHASAAGARLFAAARIGGTRLIDNMAVKSA